MSLKACLLLLAAISLASAANVTKSFNITSITDVSANNVTLTLTGNLSTWVTPNPPLADQPVSLSLNGQWHAAVEKTGLWVEIVDEITTTVYYSSQFYLGAFAADAPLAKTIRWMVPAYMTSSWYEIRASVRDWATGKTEYA